MIALNIPGYTKDLEIHHLVIDFNGTLAVDGKLILGVKEALHNISEKLQIHVLTSDAYGTAAGELKDVSCQIIVLQNSNQDYEKAKYVAVLGKDKVISVGNGNNDRSMLKLSAIGMAVIQEEGASSDSLTSADVICKNIIDALSLLHHPLKLIATLRS